MGDELTETVDEIVVVLEKIDDDPDSVSDGDCVKIPDEEVEMRLQILLVIVMSSPLQLHDRSAPSSS